MSAAESTALYGATIQNNKDEGNDQQVEPAAESKLMDRLMLLAFIIIVVDTLVVGGVVYIGWDLYSDIQDTAAPFNALRSYSNFNHTDSVVSAPEMESREVMDRFTSMMSGAGTFFVFGNATSNVAAFATNLMRYDFKGLATTAENFAKAVNKTMADSPGCNLTQVYCNGTAPGGSEWYVPQCPPTIGYPNVHQTNRWCFRQDVRGGLSPDQSFYINCNMFGCPNEGIQTVANVVASVAKQMKEYDYPSIPQDPNAGSPAFSSGIFRLDRLLDWSQSQMAVGPWKAMAGTCVDFMNQMKTIDWSNCYTYTEGGKQKESCWNVSPELHAFAERYGDLCKDLTNLADVSE